jgi:hypothetical protein
VTMPNFLPIFSALLTISLFLYGVAYAITRGCADPTTRRPVR